MIRIYNNPWIPKGALDILESQSGTIIDVGGGAAPYFRADHILDIQPFSSERLAKNAWGNKDSNFAPTWRENQYTQFDLLSGRPFPFQDKQFDLGLSSHCFEDLCDPIPAVNEMRRVCKKILIICPSRLLEQTRGIEHPRYSGFLHHIWMVFEEQGQLVFQRKSQLLNLKGCYLECPVGKTLPVDLGAMFFYGQDVRAVRREYFNEEEEYKDLCKFVNQWRGQNIFIPDTKASHNSIRYRLWWMNRKWLGRP